MRLPENKDRAVIAAICETEYDAPTKVEMMMAYVLGEMENNPNLIGIEEVKPNRAQRRAKRRR